jgi:hypothetical protein
MNGLLPILEKLKNVFDGEFILTPSVKSEIIDRPMKIKKYKLEAIQIKNLLDKGIFKLSSEVISDNRLDAEIKKILKITNGVLKTSQTGEKIKIIHEGEAACLAFSNLCGVENVIVIDERTTRLLTEAPHNLEKLMERKLHIELDSNIALLNNLKRYKFIRSAELLYIAYKKDLFEVKKDKQLLDALLYGVKFKGSSISSGEIEKIKKLV